MGGDTKTHNALLVYRRRCTLGEAKNVWRSLFGVLSAVPLRSFDGKSLPNGTERIAFNDLSRRNRLDDGASDMCEAYRTTGQEDRIYIIGGKPRLIETDFDSRTDAVCQLLGMVEEIAATNGNIQTWLNPIERYSGSRIFR
jgi:hypothetical protein